MKKFTLCGGNGLGVPPVPIPNTEVKPQHADGTWLETARESRSLPHPLSPLAIAGGAFFVFMNEKGVGPQEAAQAGCRALCACHRSHAVV